jgi:hypothetical protein
MAMVRQETGIGAMTNTHHMRHVDPWNDSECMYLLNGKGPIKGHCLRCDALLKPSRPYRVYDNGKCIVCTLFMMSVSD